MLGTIKRMPCWGEIGSHHTTSTQTVLPCQVAHSVAIWHDINCKPTLLRQKEKITLWGAHVPMPGIAHHRMCCHYHGSM